MLEKDNRNLLLDSGTTTYEFAGQRWTNLGEWTIAEPTANVWHNFLITYDYGSTANDPLMYLGGVSKTVTETSVPSSTLLSDTGAIVVGNRPSANRVWGGRVCEVAIWNRILNASEAAGIGKGFSPLFYPNGLVFYTDLVRDVPNRLASTTITTTGTAVVDHPAIIYPTQPISGFAAATVVAGRIMASLANSGGLAARGGIAGEGGGLAG